MTPPKEKKEGENVARQFKTIEFDDRKTIASMYANGAIAGEIAQKIGVSRTTVYTELKRGQDGVTVDERRREMQMSDTCGRCGRRLKDPFFREVGYGRTCAAKLGITLPQKKKKGKRTDAQEEKVVGE